MAHVSVALERLLYDLERAEEKMNEDMPGARAALEAVRGRATALKVRSAYLAWKLAVAYDSLEEPEMAVKFAEEALELDPLALPFRGSFGVIARRIRSTMLADDVNVVEQWVANFYRLLVGMGEADPRCHLVMARHEALNGRLPQSRKLLEALTLLAPTFAEGWAELSLVARQMGDVAAAENAALEAAAAGSASTPFVVPGIAKG